MAPKEKPARADKKIGVNNVLEFLTKESGSCLVDLTKTPEECPHISSGSMVVDLLAGIGGFPVGGIVEIAGEFSSGKTTLALSCAVGVQKQGGLILYVDFEHGFDPWYAQGLGIDLTPPTDGGKFILLQPDTLEQGWDTIQKLLDTGEISLLVVDSVAAALPSKQYEGEAGSGQIGLQAALLAPQFNKLASKCNKYGTTALLLNQIRIKMEKRGMTMLVTKDTSGGNALKHYCLMRLFMNICGKIEDAASESDDKEFVANEVKVQFVKNKKAAPYKIGTFVIRYGVGVDNEYALMTMAKEADVMQQSGSYFIFNLPTIGEVKIQGREPVRARIREDEAFRNDLLKQLGLAAK